MKRVLVFYSVVLLCSYPLYAGEQKNSVIEQKAEQISSQDMMNQLLPFFQSESIEKAVALFKNIPSETTYAVAQMVAQNNAATISRDNAIQFITGLTISSDNAIAIQNKLLDLIVANNWLYKGTPILFIAAKTYPQTLPVLLGWIDNQGKIKTRTLPIYDARKKALQFAVTHNDLAALQVMHNNGLTIDAKLATQLAWMVVEKKKDVAFIPYLKGLGADVNAVKRIGKNKGYTMLITAVSLDHYAMVKALVAAGADVNAIADPNVGSALQKSIEVGSVTQRHDIEAMLREAGARD